MTDKSNTVVVKNPKGIKAVKAMTKRLMPDSSITHFDEKADVIILSSEISRRKRITVGKIIVKPDPEYAEDDALYDKVKEAINYSGLGR